MDQVVIRWGAIETEHGRKRERLNLDLVHWIQARLIADPRANLSDGILEYVEYSSQVEERYHRKYGLVLTYGNGERGQLGHGLRDDDMKIRIPRVVGSLTSLPVCRVACGRWHSAVSTAAGQVFTWGCNNDGSLGRLTKNAFDEALPGEVLIHGEVIYQVSAGDYQTLAVAVSGNVYSWGCYKDSNKQRFFELCDDAQDISTCRKCQELPQRVPGLTNVGEVRCGATFNIALTNEGRVYSWGLGEAGALGRPVAMKEANGVDYTIDSLKDRLRVAMMIPEGNPLGRIKAIGAGSNHCFLISASEGRVYASGLNMYGQLGVGDIENRSTVTHVPGLDGLRITDITGGTHHSLALSSRTKGGSGNVYAFGRADAGQLGTTFSVDQERVAFSTVPIEVEIPGSSGGAVHIAAGYLHSLCLTAERSGNTKLYLWGGGELPKPDEINLEQTDFEKVHVCDLDAGEGHIAIVASRA